MRRRRLLLAVGLFAVLTLTAGCTGIGEDLDEERLAENATYDWDDDATGHVVIENATYRAVFDVTNGSAVEVYQRDALGTDRMVQVSAVQFRYPNGTVVDAEGLDVAVEDSRVNITPPAEEGKVAYTAPTDPKALTLPVTVAGSYHVVLPPDMRVSNFLFGTVRPGGYGSERVGDRVHLRWDELTTEQTVVVQSYLGRDLYIFGGVVAALAVVGAAGLLYYRLQIRKLEEEREEAGLNVDVDQDDDSGGGPPLR